MLKEIKYSVFEWCKKNSREDILERWDYDLNGCGPESVECCSKNKRWLKCPDNIHESELFDFDYLYRNPSYKAGCRKCNSFAQYVIDKHSEEYLQTIWSDKNNHSPWDYSHGSNQKAWFNCLKNPEHVYTQVIFNRVKDCECPICNNKNTHSNVARENSLGIKHPEALSVWSDKNENTPYDYSYSSGLFVWWKCENGIHSDFERKISNSRARNFKCPICARINKKILRGPDHPNWRGTTPENVLARMNSDYKYWRISVYQRDGYLCQICLNKTHTRLQAHHILSFARNPDLRYAITNGICLCDECHDNHFKGSFHQMYGTINNTPEQLQEYAEQRRKQLGINIPFNIYDYMSSIEDDNLEIDSSQLDLWEEWEE